MHTLPRTAAKWIKRPGPGLDKTVYYHRPTGGLYRDVPEEILQGIEHPWFSDSFVYAAPLKAYFDFTYRCNLECKHCITSSSPKIDISTELSTPRVLELISELATMGVLEIATGGGEPFVHPDWEPIFRQITASGVNLILTTNGLLLGSHIIKTLQEICPLEVRVSFDGGPTLHEHVRGPKAYSKALMGLAALLESGLNTTARLTLCREAERDLAILFEDLERIGARRIKIAVTKLAGRAATASGRHLVRTHVNDQTVTWLRELGDKTNIEVQLSADDFPITPADAHDPKLRDAERPNCGAGFETCYISPRGRVLGCVAIPDVGLGELHANSFMEVWQGNVATQFRNTVGARGERRICDALQHNTQMAGQDVASNIIPMESLWKKPGT